MAALSRGADDPRPEARCAQLYECRPTTEILERRWRRNASFEVCRFRPRASRKPADADASIRSRGARTSTRSHRRHVLPLILRRTANVCVVESVVCSGMLFVREPSPGTNSPMQLARTQTRIMSSSTTLGRRVLASTDSPNRVIFWQKQEYVVRITGSKKVRVTVIPVIPVIPMTSLPLFSR